MHGPLAITAVFASTLLVASANAGDSKAMLSETFPSQEAVHAGLMTGLTDGGLSERVEWVRRAERSRSVSQPTKLAIIACRVEANAKGEGSLTTEPDWHLPVECMRVIETVTDAASLNHLWLRQITPNLGDHGTCAEVAMNYAPIWEASHRNWLIVKAGCPTKIVDADGNTIGWHMPECQGTLPGTTYPLRCRFDPSEI